MVVGGRLWIGPSWERPPPAFPALVLDPGPAFGTGGHATTRLCLECLAEWIRGGETVIDYGCGSGILALAALRLGAARGVAVDNDPSARTQSERNARANGLPLEIYAPESLPGVRGDVVVANLFAGLLVRLARRLAGRTAPEGLLILSGILEARVAEVAAAYEAWFPRLHVRREGEWVALWGAKRKGRGTTPGK